MYVLLIINNTNNGDYMKKNSFYINITIIIITTLIISLRIYNLKVTNSEYYQEQYLIVTDNIIEGSTAPRGRILDINHNVLVDNEEINTITFRLLDDIDPINSALELINLIDITEASSEEELINYYLDTNNPYIKLTEEEIKKYQEKILTKEDIILLQTSRITEEDLSYDLEMNIAINLYYQMVSGFNYDTKILKNDVTNEECAKVIESNISGILCEKTYKRVVVENAISSIYGTTGNITNENKDYYLELGYDLDDTVGLSYLEYQYDEYLKGIKTKYQVNKDNSLTIYEEGSKGNDLVLSIDINLVNDINKILEENLLLSKELKKTEYFNNTYVIVSDPNTGAILSMNGLQILDDNKNIIFQDITSTVLTNSFTAGSVIKGASMSVGYQNNIIPDQEINDSCVKLYLVPEKCSFKPLGYLNDIEALKMSSNYYQFLLAIALTNQEYKYNMDLNATEEHFNTYRNTFKNFGLGTTTGIDLPNETTGIKGTHIADDLYLNLTIGQYDTYTALGLTQYINTIANNGARLELQLMDSIINNQEVIIENDLKIMNTITNSNFTRIKEGLYEVVNNGTGRGYTNTKYFPAGKTGTSETYYDKDTTTITQVYSMFAPLNDPKYSITVITPHISYNTEIENDTYIAPINRYISNQVSELVFDKY